MRPLLLCIALLLVGANDLAAQGGLPTVASSEQERSELLRAERIRERAVASFDALLEESRTAEDGERASDDPQLGGELRELRGAYVEELDATLLELEADGVLTLDEVRDELGELRQRYEQEVELIRSSRLRTDAPPPLRSDFESAWSYGLELARYTLTTRNEPRAWLTFGAWILGGVLFAWGLQRLARKLAEHLVKRDYEAVAAFLRSTGGPLYLGSIAASLWIAFQPLWLPSPVEGPLSILPPVLLVGALFWLLWIVAPAAVKTANRFMGRSYGKPLSAAAERILERALQLLVMTGLAIVVVQVILDSSLTEVFTGLGVLGIALYFLLRGTIENLAASFAIFADKPFEIGDLVIHDDEWGHIERVGFRSTSIRTLEGHLITIPNKDLIEEAVHNVGARPSIRRRFRLGIVYETPKDKIEEALEILRDILDGHECMPDDQPPRVEFEGFGESSLDLFVQYHYEPPEFYEALSFHTEVNLAICERFADAGIEIAYHTERHVLTTAENAPLPQVEVVQSEATESAERDDS